MAGKNMAGMIIRTIYMMPSEKSIVYIIAVTLYILQLIFRIHSLAILQKISKIQKVITQGSLQEVMSLFLC